MPHRPRFLNFGRGVIAAALMLASAFAAAQDSFRVELGQDGETIADMRPVFLTFESRPMPNISPAEVARRYQRLFDSTDEPEVRIDALNRLANIQQASGQVAQPDDAEEQRLYREALDSYESIVERGSFQGKLDELLYQMAKAHAYVGQAEESIQRLKQLAGLYPKSPLVPEARFRIAESAFSAGHYSEAEAEYGRLIAGAGGDSLKNKARYMQGWSQYKQGAAGAGNAIAAWNRAAASFLTVLDRNMPTAEHIVRVSATDRELVDDTLRILALMAAGADGNDGTEGTETLNAWLEVAGAKPYDYLLFDRLADHYASEGDYARSVAVNRRFVTLNPEHRATPAFMAQTVDLWQQAGEQQQARKSQGEFIAAFRSDAAYQLLDNRYQDLWRTYARGLADYHYDQGQRLSQSESFATAAGYYESLSKRTAAAGEMLRLAGDARLQAQQYPGALENYRQAAYHTPGYEAAADAAWAAITVQRDGVDTRIAHAATLQDLSAEAERFATRYQNDPRLAGLFADLANRWLAREGYTEARQFAERVTQFDEAAPGEHYSAWLVLGEVFTETAEHQLAEHAWRQADGLIRATTLANVDDGEAGEVKRQLAAAVYRQGEAAQQAGDTDLAVAHFQRVDSVLPGSDIAIRGRYDAANSLLLAERWQSVINELIRFRADFATHQLTAGVSDKLVLAYTSSDQPVRAAAELMETAQTATDPWPRKLQAAELFHQGQAVARRDAIYRDYLDVAAQPASAEEHVRLQTMRKRLLDAAESVAEHQAQMVNAELASPWHSEETLRWSAAAALALGRSAADEFEAIGLGQPLQHTLARKQVALERAQQRFAEAESFDQESVGAETLYRRAELYRVLAQDLMNSAIPEDLNELEQAQYQMLLEEEAYPFEEKAIELHARNHQRLADTGYSEWIERSLQVLADMFPGRYDRDVQWMTWSGEPADDA